MNRLEMRRCDECDRLAPDLEILTHLDETGYPNYLCLDCAPWCGLCGDVRVPKEYLKMLNGELACPVCHQVAAEEAEVAAGKPAGEVIELAPQYEIEQLAQLAAQGASPAEARALMLMQKGVVQ